MDANILVAAKPAPNPVFKVFDTRTGELKRDFKLQANLQFGAAHITDKFIAVAHQVRPVCVCVCMFGV